MRIASPHAAIDIPASSDCAVGCARISTSTPKTKPRATRNLASVATNSSPTRRLRAETPLDRAEHVGHLDIEQAHAIEPAAAQVMALADAVSRYDDVERRHRTVAHGTGRPVNADDRRAERRGDVRRTGV